MNPQEVNRYLRRISPTDYLVGLTSLVVEGSIYDEESQYDEYVADTIIGMLEDDVLVRLFSSFQMAEIPHTEHMYYSIFSIIIKALFHIIIYRPHLIKEIKPHLNTSILLGRIEGVIRRNNEDQSELDSILYSLGEDLNSELEHAIKNIIDSEVMTDIYSHFDGTVDLMPNEPFDESDIECMYHNVLRFVDLCIDLFLNSAYFVNISCNPKNYLNDMINVGTMFLIEEFRYNNPLLINLVCEKIDLDLFIDDKYKLHSNNSLVKSRPTIFELCYKNLVDRGFILQGNQLYKQSSSRKGAMELWLD